MDGETVGNHGFWVAKHNSLSLCLTTYSKVEKGSTSHSPTPPAVVPEVKLLLTTVPSGIRSPACQERNSRQAGTRPVSPLDRNAVALIRLSWRAPWKSI